MMRRMTPSCLCSTSSRAAAARRGPTPRDATPAMFVAAACEDAARVYAFDARAAPSKRFTPLCAASAPAGSTPASLRLAPDGAPDARARDDAATPASRAARSRRRNPRRSSARLRRRGGERRERARRGRDVDAGGDASAGEGADDTGDTNDTDGEAAARATEARRNAVSRCRPAHEDAAFAAATPLVWLAAARLHRRVRCGAVPRGAAREPPGEGDADVSGGDEEGRDGRGSPGASAEDARSLAKSRSVTRETRRRKRKRSRLPTFAPARPTCISAWTPPGAPSRALAAWPGCNRAAMFSTRARAGRARGGRAQTRRRALAPRRARVRRRRRRRTMRLPSPRPRLPPTTRRRRRRWRRRRRSRRPPRTRRRRRLDAPFPVTASAAVSVGEVSLFALGLVDGTVLVLDARLGTVAARLDRLGAVAPPTETLSESLFATEATARASLPRLRDRAADADGSFGDGAGPPARTSLTSLTACVALAFSIANDARRVLTPSSSRRRPRRPWTATFIFTVAPGSTFPKNPPASRFAKPRGDRARRQNVDVPARRRLLRGRGRRAEHAPRARL